MSEVLLVNKEDADFSVLIGDPWSQLPKDIVTTGAVDGNANPGILGYFVRGNAIVWVPPAPPSTPGNNCP